MEKNWKDMAGTDCNVALTTTKLNKVDQPCPVCIVEQVMEGVPPLADSLFKEILAQSLQEMLTDVTVNKMTRTVIIGNSEWPLATYTARPAGGSHFEDAFFIQWEKLKMMVFEMHIFGEKETLIISVNGLYNDIEKKWYKFFCSVCNSLAIFNNHVTTFSKDPMKSLKKALHYAEERMKEFQDLIELSKKAVE